MKTSKSLLLNTGNVVLALDLDNTLAHYKDEMKGLFVVTREMNIPENIARSALQAAIERDFSFSKLYQILTQKAHVYISEQKFMERIGVWFRENYALYDDALLFLRDYLERVPLFVVTAGNEEFQREKIRLLDFYPNDVVVVPMDEPKLDTLKSIWEKYEGTKTIVYVDDNPGEFTRISFDEWFGPRCHSVRMRRSDSPYINRRNDMSDDTIASFDELRAIVPLEKEVV